MSTYSQKTPKSTRNSKKSNDTLNQSNSLNQPKIELVNAKNNIPEPINYDEYDEIIEIEENQFNDLININSFNMNILPANLSICTMSLACHLGTKFNVENIYKYLQLETNYIVAVKSPKGIRCMEGIKERFKSTNKNSKKVFSNQYTIIIQVSETKFLNVKLFKNGSIQMTGCKELSDANIAINKLIMKLGERLFVKDEDVLSEITFVDEPNNLKMSNFKIDLIVSNFGVNYLINKENLYKLLTEKNILSRLSVQHSCVNIKHKIQTEENVFISVFVFQTGNIIITGGKKAEHVTDAYNFIVGFLSQYKQKIMKKDISKLLNADDFKEILEEVDN
jgi:TATA-box binding protein (TBP) (component of TFIID and TFIIIB)